jgi:GNAT superfamily N-acetyltransferase
MSADQLLHVEPLTAENFPMLETFFAAHGVTAGCWCMWFIIPVKDYHLSAEANRERLRNLVETSAEPMGYLALEDGEAIGWCAAGPRERYVRGIRTPTYRDPGDDREGVWLVPCFFVSPAHRGRDIADRLLATALEAARAHRATAIDGFPFTDAKRRTGGDTQVGFAAMFSKAGFRPLRSPNPNRVVMRLEF